MREWRGMGKGRGRWDIPERDRCDVVSYKGWVLGLEFGGIVSSITLT